MGNAPDNHKQKAIAGTPRPPSFPRQFLHIVFSALAVWLGLATLAALVKVCG